MNYFIDQESKCKLAFSSLPNMYHLCTNEDYPILFTNDDDYAAAMCILAICSKLFSEIIIITFEIMSNHIHIVLCGDLNEIKAMFNLFKKRLGKYFESKGRFVDTGDLDMNIHVIDNLEYARNSIAYTNRNAFVVLSDTTPFSYRWGANNVYFHPEAKRLYEIMKEPLKFNYRRQVFRGRGADDVKDLYTVDEIISPLSFCEINSGESLFRDAKQYFNKISKNVESYEEIAKTIGESIYFTDDDLYMAIRQIAKDRYGISNLTSLTPTQK